MAAAESIPGATPTSLASAAGVEKVKDAAEPKEL